MIAIASAPVADRPQGVTQTSRRTPRDPDLLPGLADDDAKHFDSVASPWRAPLFDLSFVAGALLLLAVATILLWRGVRRL